jgi:hypothetical protein
VALNDAFCIQISALLSMGAAERNKKSIYPLPPEILERNQNWNRKCQVYFNTETHNCTAVLKDILKLLKHANKLFFLPPPFQKHPRGAPIAAYIYIWHSKSSE